MNNKRIAQKGNTDEEEKVERTAGAMVESWEYANEISVFALGEAVIAAVKRLDTHVFTLWYASMSMFFWFCDSKGHSFDIDGLSIASRGYKRAQQESALRDT